MNTASEAENMRVRAALMRAVRERISVLGWSPSTVAANLGITQPRVSELLDGHISEFSLDTLLALADRVGVHLQVVVDADSCSPTAS